MRGLIGAAEQISRGEFRQALVSTRRDKLGELEQAFENMRLALRNTTFTRNYLHSVLNSMTDAVFVTAPGGRGAHRQRGGLPPDRLSTRAS